MFLPGASIDMAEKLAPSSPPCPYYHVTVTVPATLRDVLRSNQSDGYHLLMKAAADAVLALCRDPCYMAATPAILAVLHTWTAAMEYHAHVHTAAATKHDISGPCPPATPHVHRHPALPETFLFDYTTPLLHPRESPIPRGAAPSLPFDAKLCPSKQFKPIAATTPPPQTPHQPLGPPPLPYAPFSPTSFFSR